MGKDRLPMYVKLTLRNAKRSIKDYLIYMTTMTIMIAIMLVSNLLACASQVNGMQGESFPILIAFILIVLLNYINKFIIRQRAKEFAVYILLGMNQSRIAFLFFGELLILGILCFAGGIVTGGVFFGIFTFVLNRYSNLIQLQPGSFWTGVFHTFLYFCFIELASLLWSKRCIIKLRITQLMEKGRKNERVKGKHQACIWTVLFVISLFVYLVLLGIISQSKDSDFIMYGLSLISIPVLLVIFTFYKGFFNIIAWLRVKRVKPIYQGDNLYFISQLLSKIRTSAVLDGTLSMCFLFSAVSFIFGMVILKEPKIFYEESQKIWMAFIQVSISVIFIVIFFSVLAVQQIVDFRTESFGMRVMYYLGKTKQQQNATVLKQICIKFIMPVLAGFLLLGCSIIPVNQKLNSLLISQNVAFAAMGGFLGCFVVLFLGYLCITYKVTIQPYGPPSNK